MKELKYDDIEIGYSAQFTKQITTGMEDAFRAMSGDENPIHWDDEYARQAGGGGKFKSHIAFGMLTAALYSTLAGMYIPGKYSLIHSLELSFKKPVYAGDVLTVSGEVADKQDALKLLLVKAKITNQDGETVSKATMKVLVLE